jgi:hypothetical protein
LRKLGKYVGLYSAKNYEGEERGRTDQISLFVDAYAGCSARRVNLHRHELWAGRLELLLIGMALQFLLRVQALWACRQKLCMCCLYVIPFWS